MAKVLLKDVVQRIKDKVDKDNTELEYYIGGEHFDYGEICITKRGVIAGSTIGPAFHMQFKPGDVLLMSRNPHLRKAGVVDFEGICSDVSYVCRTKDENVLLQRYLPFIFQTDDFWNFAEQNKHGSTNFFLNWSDFEKYEFELPEIEEQKRLTELLWSAQDTKTAYQELLRQTDELVKSQFIELFGELDDKTFFPRQQWKDVVTIINGKDHKSVSGNGIYGVYGTGGRMMNCSNYMCEEGTIIMGRKGTIDKPYIVNEKCWVVDTAFGVVPKKEFLNLNYLFQYTKQIDYKKLNKACTLPSVTKSDLLQLWINIPPMELQNQFEDFVRQTDKSKYIWHNALNANCVGGECYA